MFSSKPILLKIPAHQKPIETRERRVLTWNLQLSSPVRGVHFQLRFWLFFRIFLNIPNVIAAIIVLILGILFGNLLSAIVQTAASNAGIAAAEGLAKTSLYAVVFFAGTVALIQLGIGEEIVTSAFVIALGAAALALALAFGLGGRMWLAIF